MGKHTPLTGAERSANYRARMRAKGYRLKQFWLPDTSTPEFIAEARRQSRLIAAAVDTEEVQKLIDHWNDELFAELDALEEDSDHRRSAVKSGRAPRYRTMAASRARGSSFSAIDMPKPIPFSPFH